jgi:hypothetical protein
MNKKPMPMNKRDTSILHIAGEYVDALTGEADYYCHLEEKHQ